MVSYEYPWQTLLSAFKYRQALAFAPLMAHMAGQRAAVVDLIARADIVIGMPLTEQRIGQRGFNQAHEWAKRLSAEKTRANVLLRLGHLSAQAGLGRSARQQQGAALMGSFQVDPHQQQWVKRRKVLLVDDVYTTGTTLHAAAAALCRAGADEVKGLVFARTERTDA